MVVNGIELFEKGVEGIMILTLIWKRVVLLTERSAINRIDQWLFNFHFRSPNSKLLNLWTSHVNLKYINFISSVFGEIWWASRILLMN